MADNETIADIIAKKRTLAAEMEKALGDQHSSVEMLKDDADRLEAAYKREVDALKQRRTELNAEFAAKDEVIKRLNDAIAEEQRRKMAPPENPSAVGDAAKLREALTTIRKRLVAAYESEACFMRYSPNKPLVDLIDAALAAPPRNCDSYDSADEMMKEYADDAFLEEWKEWRETGKCHPLMIDAFLCINWLFLTNEKGGNDGSK